MEISILLARVIGLLLLVVGFGYILNAKHYSQMISRFLENSEFYYFSGVLAFAVGILIVNTHNVWITDWRLIITLAGWGSLLKGTVRILAPGAGKTSAASFREATGVIGTAAAIMMLLGAWLTYEGFTAAL